MQEIADNQTTQHLIDTCLAALTAEGSKAPAVMDPPDWRLVLKAAIGHKVLPLFYQGMRSLPNIRDIPEDIVRYAALESKKVLAKNILTRSELIRLSDAMRLGEVPHVVYKGVVTVQRYYPGIGMREFNDNDFLLRREDVTKTREILADLGYAPIIDYNTLGEIKIAKYEKEISLVRPRPGGGIFEADIHWLLLKPGIGIHIDYSDLENGITSLQTQDHSIPVLKPELEFIAMCVHNGVNDGWGTLKHLFDLHMMLTSERERLDARQIAEFAREHRLLDIVQYSLLLCKRYFGTHAIADIFGQLAVDKQVEQLVDRHRFHYEETNWQFLKRQFAFTKGFQKLVVAKNLLLENASPNHADEAFVRLPYPAKLYPLYFLVKPFRLLLRGANESKFDHPDVT